MTRLLIRRGAILSMDDAIGDLPRGDVLIEGERIADVAPRIVADDTRVIDASDCIVLPGFINAHLHNWQTLLRGIGADWTAADYDDILHAQLAPRYSPADLATATRYGALAQLDAGATTIFDWCHNNPTPDHTDAALDALEQSGIRAVFGHGTVKPDPKPGQPHYSQIPHPRGEIERLRKGRLASDDARVTLAMCILGPEYATLDVCRRDFALAREFGLFSSAHVWGHAKRTVPGGYRTLAAEKLLSADHNIVHGNYLSDEELGIILDAGISATSAPAPELRLRANEPLSGRIRRRGGRPSIGVDGNAFGCDRMLDALRFALQSQRLFNNLAAARERPNETLPVSINTREALAWGTIDNARALRLDHRIGSLRPGKLADLIVVRRDSLTVAPATDPAQAVVNYAQSADIETVLVGGRIVKEGGRLTGKAVDKARSDADQTAARLLASLPPDLRARCALGAPSL
jgi:5-methylthioadenosine/S-adenosylhomocysteine deaminase